MLFLKLHFASHVRLPEILLPIVCSCFAPSWGCLKIVGSKKVTPKEIDLLNLLLVVLKPFLISGALSFEQLLVARFE